MCKKLICLIFFLLASGIAQGVAYDKAAWYDSRYPTNWCDAASALNLRNGVAAAGYPILDSDQLKTWMDGHIADGQLSVVIFCQDIPPDTVAETMSDTCTLRKYLNAGGKIVFPDDIPFYNQGHADGSTTNWAAAGAAAILGFATASGGWGSGNTVTLTADGVEWGLTETWSSQRPASLATIAAENLTVLATDNDGEAAAWVKHYLPGDSYRGFVYTHDVGGLPNVGDMMRLAEYVSFKARNPVPADGSNAGPEISLPNVYMILDYTPGDGVITHTAYFSDVEQDVIDRLPAKSLGSTPPWPAVDDNAFVVGYDDAAIVEYARAPLVAGTTYYWCVDEFDGTDTWPGNVWSFTVMPPWAWGPDPADGEELVSTDPTLSWNLGDLVTSGYSVRYILYVGTDEAAVEAIATGNLAAPEYVGAPITPTSFDITGLDPETEYFWRVDTRRQQALPPFPTFHEKGEVWSFTTAPPGVGNILAEWWLGIGGVDIVDLTSAPDYPDSPSESQLMNSFEFPEWPNTDLATDYGARVHGWLYVAQTGDYTFWIATDDAGELWLSTDSNPANADLIAWITGHVSARDWDGTTGNAGEFGPAQQMSVPIHLVGGEQYYISGLMKEAGGGDHISVAWQGPDSGGVREIIPGNHLKAFVPVVATNPDPADNSADAPLDVTVSWSAGIDESTDMPYTTQHVYIGGDPVAVAAANTDSPEYKGGPSGPNEYGPLSLGYYEDVYWRIDGVVASSGEVEYPGAVWTFRTIINPAWASNPNPNDGATGVDGNVALSWTPGAGATAHTVYFGADDPANMVQVAGPSTSTTYNPPGNLDLGTTYYWRVVESPGGGEGLTWQFTTSNYLVVDDMESYTPWTTPLNNIFEIWLDGFGDCAGSGNDTGAVLTENADPVLGGVQSMKYEFDNDETVFSPCDSAQVGGRLKYSKIEVQTSDLVSGIGSDWTIGGVKALRVPFYGQAGNATTESLWVQLQDGSKGYGEKVFYGTYEGESLDDFDEASWHDWNIDLNDCDVDLTNVVSITIGIGKVGTEGETAFGSGTLFFDDIRLYAPMCVPARSSAAFAKVDYSGPAGVPDCVVDYHELEVMTRDWLESDYLRPANPLIARWQLDGNYNDSSGHGNTGVPVGAGMAFVTDPVRGQVLTLPGGDDIYVDCNSVGISGADSRTIACWAKADSTTITDWTLIFGFTGNDDASGGNGSHFNIGSLGGPGGIGAHCWGWEETIFSDQEGLEWRHYAMTYDGTTIQYYGDGNLMDTDLGKSNVQALTHADRVHIGSRITQTSSFPGSVDDACIFDVVLDENEIGIVMEGGADTLQYHPLGSPANLIDGEGIYNLKVNFRDYSLLLDSWGDTEEWPAW